MKDLLSKTSITAILLAIWVAILIFFPAQIEETIVYAKEEIPEAQNVDFVSLFPDNYKYPEVISPTQIPVITVIPTSTAIPTPTKIKPSAIPKPLPEKTSSTIEERDKDRVLYFEVFRDKVEEYYFHYDQMPSLYSNKSKKLLTTESSDTIYFYNEKDNKTNALALKAVDSTYLFNQVPVCEGNFSNENKINFLYSESNFEITLCKESLEKYPLSISN